MAYFVGTANSFSDLKSVLEAALRDTGWAEEGNFLSKEGTLVRFDAVDTGTSNARRLSVQVANSQSDLAPIAPYILPILGRTAADPDVWTWPVSYHIHALDAPNEVYMVVQYSSFFQTLAFGRSPTPGVSGTGNWAHATHFRTANGLPTVRDNCCKTTPSGTGIASITSPGQYISPIPFFVNTVAQGYNQPGSSVIHGTTDLSGQVSWSDPMEYLQQGNKFLGVESATPLVPLMACIPNDWNSEAVLLPCQIFQRRDEKKVSLIGELSHYRLTRNDYLPDGEVITIGSERWKVYSAYRRNTSERNGLNIATDHSGTVAFAVRYDGP